MALLWLLGGGLTVVRAATFTVTKYTDTNDGSCTPGDCSLREAIIAANGNGQADTITLGSGTYALTLTGTDENNAATGDLDITQPLTVTGAGPSQTIIDASGLISDRVFHINMSANVGTVVISGVTIINGKGVGSGGIFNSDADLILFNTVISNNIANSYGGGVSVIGGSVTLNETQILSNTAKQRGGGVYVYNSAATFTQTGDSTIAYNKTAQTTTNGGGLFIDYGSATLSDGQIHNNTAAYGGWVFILYGSATLNGGQILSNTASSDGGGVYVSDDTGAFTQTGTSIIAYNTVITNGGGVYVNNSSAMLDGGQILNNRAANGGGVYLNSAAATLTQAGDGTIALNTADNGSGVYVNYGNAVLSGGEILSNTASSGSAGGGVYVDNATAAFTQTGVTTITHNTSHNNGGGLYIYQGSVTLSGGAICNNNASGGSGGGVHVASNAKVNASRGQIISNTAHYGGGGISHFNGTLTLVNTTVSGNQATSMSSPASEGGGGLYVGSGTAVLTYTTVASNTAASGGRGIHKVVGTVLLQDTIVAYNGAANCNTGLTSNDYNLDSGNTCGFSAPHDQPNTDPLLGTLADNGGDTLTHALLEGSPAIDNGTCVAGITTDQRSLSRPLGDDCDIGAYEYGHQQGAEEWEVYLPIIMRNHQ